MNPPPFLKRRPVAMRMLVGLAFVAVVWAVFVAHSRASLPKDCVSRLALVDKAITEWAKEQNRDTLAIPTGNDLAMNLDDRSILRCPDGGHYAFGSRALATSCSKHGHASFAVSVPPPRSKLGDFMAEVRSYLPWTPARHTGGPNSCIANLKQIEGAFQQWSVEARKQATDTPKPGEIFGKVHYIRACPICPNGGKYILGRVKDAPLCTVVGHTL